jgi:excisionase family DNA binding protein
MVERRRSQSDLMTPAQVAEYLQLHKLTIYKYIREGRLPAARIGRSLRILKADVERLLEDGKAPPAVAAPPARSRRGAGPPSVGQPAESPAAERAPGKHNEEIYVGPSRAEGGKSRDVVVNVNPIDWVVRGLH